jgi:hypothetical protein
MQEHSSNDRAPVECKLVKPKIKTEVYLELLTLAFLIALNVWLLFNLGSIDELKPDPKPSMLMLFGGLTGMIFIVLMVHELGHLIAGLAQGFDLTIFIVGPLGIKKENGKTEIYLNTNLMLAGGIAGTTPVDDHPSNGDRFRRVAIAGPMMSLVFSAICLSLAWRVGNFPSFPAGLFLLGGGFLSIGIFFATTLPAKSGVHYTDRMRYQRLMMPGKTQDIELATLRIMGSYRQHDSYRHISKSDFDLLIADDDPTNRYFGYFNLLCYQLEVENQIDPETEAAYEAAQEGISPAMVGAFNTELEKQKVKFRKT